MPFFFLLNILKNDLLNCSAVAIGNGAFSLHVIWKYHAQNYFNIHVFLKTNSYMITKIQIQFHEQVELPSKT